MDALSLDACCAEPLFPKVEAVHPRPGAEPIDIRIEHPAEGTLAIGPWPFDVGRIEMTVPCRRVPATEYAAEDAFRAAYAAAAPESYPVRLEPL